MTEDASGSTSQAANVVESLEAGTSLLLIDEDTSATNFMVRDELMQRVISRDMEPITPFLERVRELYDRWGVSTVLVAGSSGAYFHAADRVIQMDRYEPRDVTALAKREAAAFPLHTEGLEPAAAPALTDAPGPPGNSGMGAGSSSNPWAGTGSPIDRETIDLRHVEQLTDGEQTAALGECMVYAQRRLLDGKRDLRQVVDELEAVLDRQGLEGLCQGRAGVPFLARPRRQEIFACFNRYRGLEL